MYGKRQKSVKTAFKILIDFADTSKTPRKTKPSIRVRAFRARFETQFAQRFRSDNLRDLCKFLSVICVSKTLKPKDFVIKIFHA